MLPADLPFQPAALALRERDEFLRTAIDLVGPCTLVPAKRSPYEALLSAIAHQQVHGAAAAAILGRVQGLYAAGRAHVLSPDFGGPARVTKAPRYPTPAELIATPDDALRAAGLSRSKVLAMKDVAAKTLDGTVPDLRTIARLDDDAIVERLVVVRGVGRWTAEMLLIFTLGRPDVLPVDDYGVRYGFQLLHRKRLMPKPKWLAKHGERWAPYRSVASWYFWRYVDRQRELARAAAAEKAAAKLQSTKVATTAAARAATPAAAKVATPAARTASNRRRVAR
jgi:DNA-3-methyladenine glycosylase II